MPAIKTLLKQFLLVLIFALIAIPLENHRWLVATISYNIVPATDQKYLGSDPIEKEWHHESLTDEVLRKFKISPLQLIETAKYINTRPRMITFDAGYPPATAQGNDRLRSHLEWWLTFKDVELLAKRIDSDVPCVRIYAGYDNDAKEGFSTEGLEASRMIYVYMKQAYPIRLYDYSKNDAQSMMKEVRNWLAENHISSSPDVETRPSGPEDAKRITVGSGWWDLSQVRIP